MQRMPRSPQPCISSGLCTHIQDGFVLALINPHALLPLERRHNAFHRSARVAPGDWDALRPLRRLAFLSISGNQLAALPPAVADMAQLQAGAWA